MMKFWNINVQNSMIALLKKIYAFEFYFPTFPAWYILLLVIKLGYKLLLMMKFNFSLKNFQT